MSNCGSCFGSGMVRCSSCHGRGQISRLTINGDMDMSACMVCGGRGKIRCSFCRGTGKVGPDAPMQAPRARKRTAGEDVLEGRWNTTNGYYVFKKSGDSYQVEEYGLMGRTGGGTANLTGKNVHLEIANILVRFAIDLTLDADTMSGMSSVMGIPFPLILVRG